MGGVGTPIIGRPRPLPGQRRADPDYTLNCEEPHMVRKPGLVGAGTTEMDPTALTT
jgi:hypothetical protein